MTRERAVCLPCFGVHNARNRCYIHLFRLFNSMHTSQANVRDCNIGWRNTRKTSIATTTTTPVQRQSLKFHSCSEAMRIRRIHNMPNETETIARTHRQKKLLARTFAGTTGVCDYHSVSIFLYTNFPIVHCVCERARMIY